MSDAQSRPARITARSCTDTVATGSARVSPVPLAWHSGDVPWAEWTVRLGPNSIPVKVIVARVDPSRLSLSLELSRRGDAIGPWTVQQASDSAVLAVNAGQFTDDGPWGWVVHRGREWQAPGTGALAAALVVDSARAVRIVPADSIATWRDDRVGRGSALEAVQSYPQLLQRGRLPASLCRAGAVNPAHRDIRLGIGVRTNGELVVALTRYAPGTMLSSATERLPIGPTTFEMAEIMLQLGSMDAVLLDGGLSAQLRVGRGAGRREWPGLRAVPLAIVATPR